MKATPPSNTYYRIACTLPALLQKGVKRGKIAGIAPHCFDAGQLLWFLRYGPGQRWSIGEKLVCDFLLNLYDPDCYTAFNLGLALSVLDQGNLAACLTASGRCRRL